MSVCSLCPRECGVDRTAARGYCGMGEDAVVANASIHRWEEPCLASLGGAGAVFFSGCSLRCVFCQNHEISHGGVGEPVSDAQLAALFLKLRDCGAQNIDLVSPTHFRKPILRALDRVRDRLKIPVVWNSSGYEKADEIRQLSGYVDVFLPDFKYVSSELSLRLSGAADYFARASEAVEEMFRLVGYPVFSADGAMTRGVLVRHLALPSHGEDSRQVIDYLASHYDRNRLWLSLLRQYFPTHLAKDKNAYPDISRKLTGLEYDRLTEYARARGIVHGYAQTRASAAAEYVPTFSDTVLDSAPCGGYSPPV